MNMGWTMQRLSRRKDMLFTVLIFVAAVRTAEAVVLLLICPSFTEQKDLEAVIESLKKKKYVNNAKAMFQSVDEIPDKYYFMWMEVGKTYFKDLLDYDIYEDIKAYEKKVLIVHGDADDIVPLSYSRKAVKTYSSADLKVIKGAGHGFYGAEEDKAVEYMLSYLEKQKK